MDSAINAIIERNGLKPGDTMKNIKGEDIPNSVVLNPYVIAIAHGNRVNIREENALGGGETQISLNREAFETLTQFKLPE